MNLEMGTDRHVDGEVGPAPGPGFRVYFDGRVDRVQQDERDQLSQSRADLLVVAVLEPTDKSGPRTGRHPRQPVGFQNSVTSPDLGF